MNQKEASIPFALNCIQTVEFAVFKELFDEKTNEIGLTVSAEFGIKASGEREIRCLPEVRFLQHGSPFLKIGVACFFSVEEIAWNSYLNVEENTIIFPKGFTNHLLMITVGTLRGVLHAKTEGTPFNQLILPTINVADLYSENVTIKIE